MIECLNCGQRRADAADECPRCTYVGWAHSTELTEPVRRSLRERTLTWRGLRSVSLPSEA